MGWLNSVWTRRVPISVDSSAGGAAGDVNITIPKGFDDFWSVIDSSANELRVTYADGETGVAYSVDNGSGGAFDKTNRLGRIQMDAVTLPSTADSVTLFWLYYGSTSNQGTGAVVTSIATPLSGYIENAAPTQNWFPYQSQIPLQTRPRHTVHKRASEEKLLFIDLANALTYRSSPGWETALFEEPWYAVPSVLNTSGTAQAGMISASRSRWVRLPNGRIAFKMLVQAGTTATQYTALADMRTVLPAAASTVHQRLIHSLGIAVRDVQW